MSINLARLAEPFPADDIEWRVSRCGTGKKGVWCLVLAYLTARAIQSRLDSVCGPANWQTTSPVVSDLRPGIVSVAVGISIRLGGEWVTKWDCAEPTDIEPAKGGFSGAVKRAGAQWGIGRYLYRLDETFAETFDQPGKGLEHAKLKGGESFYWRPPTLPSWALPKEPEHEVSRQEVEQLKQAWRRQLASDVTDPAALLDGFARFVVSTAGDFPMADSSCWTRGALELCRNRLASPDPDGVSPNIPFEE